jgi:hypothetical protein
MTGTAAAATWYAPRDPGAPRGTLSWRLRRRARHLLKLDRRTIDQSVQAARARLEPLGQLDDEAFARHVATARLASAARAWAAPPVRPNSPRRWPSWPRPRNAPWA